MLTISNPAYQRLSAMLADRPADVAVRIFLEGRRARIRPGRRRPGDEVLEHQGRPVLLFDQRVRRHLDERVLGVRETAKGPRLKLQRAQTQDQT